MQSEQCKHMSDESDIILHISSQTRASLLTTAPQKDETIVNFVITIINKRK